MTRLDATSRIPGPGCAFRINTLHTSDTGPAYLTGTWHHGGRQPADPTCALWLMLAEREAGEVDLALFADHEQIPGAFTPIAHYHRLAPGTWTSAIAPLIAAHPYIAHEHAPTRPTDRHRAARAILAYLIGN